VPWGRAITRTFGKILLIFRGKKREKRKEPCALTKKPPRKRKKDSKTEGRRIENSSKGLWGGKKNVHFFAASSKPKGENNVERRETRGRGGRKKYERFYIVDGEKDGPLLIFYAYAGGGEMAMKAKGKEEEEFRREKGFPGPGHGDFRGSKRGKKPRNERSDQFPRGRERGVSLSQIKKKPSISSLPSRQEGDAF